MALIADILLIAGALAAAFYCMVLSRRLSRFGDLENGMGGAISALSAQVSDMTQSLERAESSARFSSDALRDATHRAEEAAARLELLLASLHDLPQTAEPREQPAASAPAPKPEPVAAAETVAANAAPAFLRRPRPNGMGRG